MPCQAHNCSFDAHYELEPNPDISGIGVVVGFVATGWATLLLLAFHYVAVASKPSTQSKTLQSDQLDDTVRKGVWEILKNKSPSPQWAPALEVIVLAMSDQQLATGLSIIVSGYFQLRCDLSFYHWEMITTLAWFSSTTHLATLLFLKDYLRRNRYIWYVRVVLMTGLAITLSVGIIFTGISNIHPAMPAKCAFTTVSPRRILPAETITMVFSEIILLGGLLIRLLEISSTISRRSSKGSLRAGLGKPARRVLVRFAEKLQRSSRPSRALFTPLVVFFLAFLITVQTVLDALVSHICGLLWLLFSLIWGTMRLFYKRHASEENGWGFGQLVPVFLLLLPVLLMAEGFSEIGFRKKASSLVNSTTDESFASQATKPEEQVQLVSTRPVDRVNNTDMPYNTAPSNKSRHAGNPDDPLCVRLRHICKREDFRTEPWYLDNLYLIMCYFASEGIMVLSLVRSDNGIWALNALLPPFFALVYLTTIPLCGILQRIQQGKSERRLSFLVRLAVDSGMRYRVARWVYFVSAPVFVIIYVSMPVEELGNVVPAAIWCLVGFVVWFAGICSILSSVYSQVLS